MLDLPLTLLASLHYRVAHSLPLLLCSLPVSPTFELGSLSTWHQPCPASGNVHVSVGLAGPVSATLVVGRCEEGVLGWLS